MESKPSAVVWVTVRGVQTRLEEKEFEAGLQSGRFSAGDLYWREGMEAWQSVPVASGTEMEKEPEKDPEALIASMNGWTHWVRRVFPSTRHHLGCCLRFADIRRASRRLPVNAGAK